MLAPTKLALSYAIFALIATAANIGAQDLLIRAYRGGFNLVVSVIAGTGAGLAVKYILDKRYIFRFRTRSVADNARTFGLYIGTGAVTTAVFWAFEFGFHYLFRTMEMRYLGGIVGLSIGYFIKYQFDKRYVFVA